MKEHIWRIDVVVVLVSVAILISLIGYAQPLVIAPLDDYESLDGNVLFEFERADVLLIDDNMDFTTPDEYQVREGSKVSLEPGVYYWKVDGILGSEIRTLTVVSRVELVLVEVDGGFGVTNAGNVRLNVDVYDEDELVGKKKLEVGEVLKDDGDKFVGSYDDE
ncbi:hypothetical protein HN903_00265 [archaeon]|jgi:hypothetical protein|nr:hypothetical protein [archaeon]MBT7128171.1 hypothetical protein [archaeon]